MVTSSLRLFEQAWVHRLDTLVNECAKGILGLKICVRLSKSVRVMLCLLCDLSIGVVVVECKLQECVLESIQIFVELLILSSSQVDLVCRVNVLFEQEVVRVSYLSPLYPSL